MGIEYKSKNKCRLVVYVGSDAYGKRQRFIKTVTYTSKRNAEKQFRDFEREVEEGLKKESNVKLSVVMDDYIASRKRKGRRSTTIHGYEIIKNRILDTIGDPIAHKVTRKMIDGWIGEMYEEYSAKTIRNTVGFLSSCYERLVDLEEVSRNPCRHAEIPEKPPRPRVILHEDDIIPFYEALCSEKDNNLDLVVATELMLFCGLRRSEVLGLRPHNIDTVMHTVHVEDARHRIGPDTYMEGTKTRGSNRVLSLPAFVFTDIWTLISLHEKNASEDKYLPSPEFLILGTFGEPMHPSVLYTQLKKFEKRHSLPEVSPHGLRHTYASLLNDAGRNMTEISGQLGHTQLTTTMNTYTHLFKEASIASKSIADDIDELVSK